MDRGSRDLPAAEGSGDCPDPRPDFRRGTDAAFRAPARGRFRRESAHRGESVQGARARRSHRSAAWGGADRRERCSRYASQARAGALLQRGMAELARAGAPPRNRHASSGGVGGGQIDSPASRRYGFPHLKQQLEQLLLVALRGLPEGLLPSPADHSAVAVERARDPKHGDFASSIALKLAKPARRNPREIAQAIVAALPPSPLLARAEVAGAGFINFFLSPDAYAHELAAIHELGERYGRSATGAGERVMVEFVSANPTGPLHVGHGRQAALGDALSSLLEAQGYAITREYYYNDAGAQIQNLALSVQARARGLAPGEPGWPKDGYAGEYIQDVARDFLAAHGTLDDLEAVRKFAVAYLRGEQDRDLKEFGLEFDVYSLESKLYTDGSLDAAVERLIASGKTY